jgi:hypothetical protein
VKRRMASTRRTALAGAVLTLAACAASAPKPAAAPPAPPPLDASYDWHVLIAAPFGSVLKDVPLTMHEVLLFRDDAPRAAAEELECFSVDGTPPRFLARAPAEYLICFKHDRLTRIEATVRLPQDQAAGIFVDACGLWMKNAGAANTQGCAGTDKGIAFAGHLDEDAAAAERQLTVKLEAGDPVADPTSERQ